MSNELNLTKDQEQRIANAQTPEEKAHVLAEAAGIAGDVIDLSDDELDNISGGRWMPKDRKDASEMLSIIRNIANEFGPEVARISAEEMDLCQTIPDGASTQYILRTLKKMWGNDLGSRG